MTEYTLKPRFFNLGPTIEVDGATVPGSFDATVETNWGPTVELSILYAEGLWRLTYVGLRGSDDFPYVTRSDRNVLLRDIDGTVTWLVNFLPTLPLTERTTTGDRKIGGDQDRFAAGVDRRSRRRPDPGLELREVAEVYLAHPDAPAKAVRERFRVSAATASRRIAEARAEGLLPARAESEGR